MSEINFRDNKFVTYLFLKVTLELPVKMAILADLDQLDLRVNLVPLATMVLLAKTESVTLVDPDLKEKLAHLDILVNYFFTRWNERDMFQKFFSAIT
jgi:hypothetical protein